MKMLKKIIEYGLYLFVFLLPWQTRLILKEGNLNGYWEYGTISIYATEILLWIIFFLAAVWWTVNKLKIMPTKSSILDKVGAIKNSHPAGDDPEGQKSKFIFAFSGLLVVWSLVSIFWADSRSLALYAWHWLAEGVGLFFVLQAIKFDSRKIVWPFILSALFQAGFGLWQFFTQSTFASKWLGLAFHDPAVSGTYVIETALRRWLRAYGALPHPNILAGFLAVAMLLTIWLYRKSDYGFKKILLPVIFAILGLGLFVTFSKGVTASFLAALIFLWIVVVLKRSKDFKIDLLKFTLIFLVIAVIFSVVFWEPVQTRLIGAERLEIKSTTERLNYSDEAWQLIKNHPLLGVGLGNYTLAVHDEINPSLQSWDYQPVHNIYLLILAELGLVGFLLWLALIATILLQNFKVSLPVTRYSLLVTLLIIGLFDHYLWSLYFGIILFWLCFSLARKISLDKLLDRS